MWSLDTLDTTEDSHQKAIILNLSYIISYHLFPWIHTGLQIRMDMENGHINTKCTKQLQYMVHILFDIIK